MPSYAGKANKTPSSALFDPSPLGAAAVVEDCRWHAMALFYARLPECQDSQAGGPEWVRMIVEWP